jgi:hypothetical protein
MPEAAATGIYRTDPRVTRNEERSWEDPSKPLLTLYENITVEQRNMPASYDALIYATDKVVRTIAESVSVVIGEACADADEKIDRAVAEIAALDARIFELQRENGELRGEIADLSDRLDRVRSARGDTDGRSLPASIVRPRAKQSRSPPKAKP